MFEHLVSKSRISVRFYPSFIVALSICMTVSRLILLSYLAYFNIISTHISFKWAIM